MLPTGSTTEQSSLGSQAIRGVSWTTLEGVLTQIGNLLIMVVMARHLQPSDVGLFAMITVFVALSETLMDSGFGNALIQKQNASHLDESSVFYFNITLGLLLVGVLCALSPSIAAFYGQPTLVSIIYSTSSILLINSFSVVQRSLLSKHLEFRTQAIASVVAMTTSGAIGISSAHLEYGVWSLVWLNVSRALVQTLLYWLISPWRPLAQFSLRSLKSMFGFGSRLMLAAFLTTGYRNLHALIIGRFFSAAELGFYTKGRDIAAAPGKAIANSLTRVAFPYLSRIQGDVSQLRTSMRRGIRALALASFPIAVGLSVVAEPLVSFLLTPKWLPCVPFLQLLCLSGALYPLNSMHLSALKAIGRSDLILRLAITKQIISIVNILIFLPFGLLAVVVGQAIAAVANFLLNGYYSRSLLRYSYRKQAQDLWLIAAINTTMGLTVLFLGQYVTCTSQVQLAIQITAGSTIYLVLTLTVLQKQVREMRAQIVLLINTRKGLAPNGDALTKGSALG